MHHRRTILYILLIVLSIILVYNFVFAPMLVQQNRQMGMGMHSRMYNNYTYNVDFWIIALIIIAIGGLILLDGLQWQNRVKRCGRCGFAVDSERWKICPLCGTAINRKG